MDDTAQKETGVSRASAENGLDHEEAQGSLAKRTSIILVSVLSIISGSLLLLENTGVETFQGIHKLWPVFPLFLGLGFLLLFKKRKPLDLVLFASGIFLCGLAVLFFVCTFYGWQIMVKGWPFFVGLVGLSAVMTSRYADRLKRFLLLSGSLFMILSLTFFLIISISANLWPSVLVIVGVWILILVNL